MTYLDDVIKEALAQEYERGRADQAKMVEKEERAREKETHAYEWQQAISWELGCQWGAQVYTLEECVEKIRELKR